MTLPEVAGSLGFYSEASNIGGPTSSQYVSGTLPSRRESEIPTVKRKRGRPKDSRKSQITVGKKSRQKEIRSSDSQPKTPTPHNVVERRYRERLNNKLKQLGNLVGHLLPHDDSSGRPAQSSKPIVLTAAIDHIKKLEADNENLTEEIKKIQGGNTINT